MSQHFCPSLWAADLVEMQKFSKWNKGVKYLLMVIDVFSKYGWIRGLKDKKTETVIYSKVNVNQGCYGQIKALRFSVNISKSF